MQANTDYYFHVCHYPSFTRYETGHKSACEKAGLSDVHVATLIQNSDALCNLLAKKFKCDAQDNNGKTPLDYAIALDNPEIIKILKSHGAKVTPRAQQKENEKPSFKLSEKKITIIDCSHFPKRKGIAGISRPLNADDIGKNIIRPAPPPPFGDWSGVPDRPSKKEANNTIRPHLLLGIVESTLLVWHKALGVFKVQDQGDWLPTDEYGRFVKKYAFHKFKHIDCNCGIYSPPYWSDIDEKKDIY